MTQQIRVGTQHFALVDDEDVELVSGYTWWLDLGAARARPKINGRQTTLLMHRLIMGVTDPNQGIDHRNGNRLDNRKCNLRLATRSQNGGNSKPFTGKQVASKGVRLMGNRYEARIYTDGKRIVLGYFATEEEAAEAYNKAAKAKWGEYAYCARTDWEVDDSGLV